ncbi:TPA: hypothetical protein HA265_02085 [Candidatus Woesearchaeota archaeon]|nr:hypothetical protein [Candidatus Woesearchaeota archaeon]
MNIERWYRTGAAIPKQRKTLSENMAEQGLTWARPKKDNFYSMAMGEAGWGASELEQLPEAASRYEMHNIQRLAQEAGIAYGVTPMLVRPTEAVENTVPERASIDYVMAKAVNE